MPFSASRNCSGSTPAEPPTLQQLARIQHIENAGAHLLALVNDVLDLSRVESGQMTVTLESVDLRSSVEDALDDGACRWPPASASRP